MNPSLLVNPRQQESIASTWSDLDIGTGMQRGMSCILSLYCVIRILGILIPLHVLLFCNSMFSSIPNLVPYQKRSLSVYFVTTNSRNNLQEKEQPHRCFTVVFEKLFVAAAAILTICQLGLPLFFVLRFAFSIIHGSGRAAKNRATILLLCIILNANWRTKAVEALEQGYK